MRIQHITRTPMARPKILKFPARLHLLIQGKAKKNAFRMACERRISIGRLFEDLLDAELARENENNSNGKAAA